MCFDGTVLMEKATIWKKYKRKYSNSNNKKLSKEWSSLFYRLSNLNIQIWIWRSVLGVESFMNEYKKYLLSLIQN